MLIFVSVHRTFSTFLFVNFNLACLSFTRGLYLMVKPLRLRSWSLTRKHSTLRLHPTSQRALWISCSVKKEFFLHHAKYLCSSAYQVIWLFLVFMCRRFFRMLTLAKQLLYLWHHWQLFFYYLVHSHDLLTFFFLLFLTDTYTVTTSL